MSDSQAVTTNVVSFVEQLRNPIVNIGRLTPFLPVVFESLSYGNAAAAEFDSRKSFVSVSRPSSGAMQSHS